MPLSLTSSCVNEIPRSRTNMKLWVGVFLRWLWRQDAQLHGESWQQPTGHTVIICGFHLLAPHVSSCQYILIQREQQYYIIRGLFIDRRRPTGSIVHKRKRQQIPQHRAEGPTQWACSGARS